MIKTLTKEYSVLQFKVKLTLQQESNTLQYQEEKRNCF